MVEQAQEAGQAAPARRGGRPSRLEAAQLQEKILEVATELFLRQGFGATTIEAVALRARISKRTFYHRFRDKAELFEAVVRRLIGRWMPPFEAQLREPRGFAEILHGSARNILAVALLPEALALHRVLLAEAQRFPELARILNENGTARGIERIAETLETEARARGIAGLDSRFAAEQFLHMVLAGPQRRALGFGPPLGAAELDRWARRSVALFLKGWTGGEAKGDGTA
jgi:TetR/AcrR family transcriptional repressor of mexJK operon